MRIGVIKANPKAIHIPMENREEYVLPTHGENENCSKFKR